MKFLVFSFTLLIFIFAGGNDLYSSNCENFGCDTTFTMESELIELPQYPDCYISFNYEWRRCGDTTEIRVRGYSIADTGGCSVIYDSLYSGGTPNWDFQKHLRELLRLELVKQSFMNLYSNASPFDKYKFECPTGQKYYSYGWKSCTKWELSTITVGNPPFQMAIYTQVECEEEACCEETMEICYNTTTQQLEMTRTLTNHLAGDCDEGENTNSESSCSTPCSGTYIE